MSDQPAHPIGQLTSSELQHYRVELERQLAEVRAEERSRASIREAITPDEIDARLQHYSA